MNSKLRSKQNKKNTNNQSDLKEIVIKLRALVFGMLFHYSNEINFHELRGIDEVESCKAGLFTVK